MKNILSLIALQLIASFSIFGQNGRVEDIVSRLSFKFALVF